MTRALVIGEALVDVVDGQPLPGGSPMNVAVGLGRLGVDTRLATRIGGDAHGAMIRRHLHESSVRLAADAVGPDPTSTAVAAISELTGAAEYDFRIHWDLPPIVLDGAYDIVHAGSLAAYLEPGCRAVVAALEAAGSHSLVSFDPNIRSSLLPEHARALARTRHLVSLSHIVKLSDEDAAWLYPEYTIEQVLSELVSLGPRLAVITRGGNGYTAMSGDHRWSRQLEGPVDVLDTIGAGDAFMSGLLYAAGEAGIASRSRDEDTTAQEWSQILDVAQRSAAITVSRAGANPPFSAELRKSPQPEDES